MNIDKYISGRHFGVSLKYHICALLAVTAWGAAFIATKVLLDNGLNPVEIYIYRMIVAYLCVLCICPRPLWSNSLADELKFLFVGMTGGSIYFIAENTAMRYTLVTNVSLIVTTAPLFSTMLVALLYKNERPSKGFVFGSLVALLGVGFVIFNSSTEIKMMPVGDLLALLASLCWAVYTILLKPLNAVYSAWFITRKTFFYGILTALPFMLVEPSMADFAMLLKPVVWGNLLALGLVCSMLAYVLWAVCNRGLGTMMAGNYLYVSPIVTLVLSAIVLSERVSWVGYTGCALIFLGMILSEKLDRKRY